MLRLRLRVCGRFYGYGAEVLTQPQIAAGGCHHEKHKEPEQPQKRKAQYGYS